MMSSIEACTKAVMIMNGAETKHMMSRANILTSAPLYNFMLLFRYSFRSKRYLFYIFLSNICTNKQTDHIVVKQHFSKQNEANKRIVFEQKRREIVSSPRWHWKTSHI